MRAYCVRHIHSIWASLDEFPLDATSPSVSTEWYSYIEDTEEGLEGSSNLHQGQWRKGRDTWGRSGRQGLHGSPELCKAKGPLNSHTAESESIPGLSGNACLAAEDTVRVTHQAALPFFSLLQVWLFLKSPNFVGLLIFFFFLQHESLYNKTINISFLLHGHPEISMWRRVLARPCMSPKNLTTLWGN